MPRYKVRFSRDWIVGRWAFTDRVLDGLGGWASDGPRLQNTWIVEFKDSPRELGRYLTSALRLNISRDAKPGAVFEIEELEADPPARKPPVSRPPASRPPSSRPSGGRARPRAKLPTPKVRQ